MMTELTYYLKVGKREEVEWEEGEKKEPGSCMGFGDLETHP